MLLMKNINVTLKYIFFVSLYADLYLIFKVLRHFKLTKYTIQHKFISRKSMIICLNFRVGSAVGVPVKHNSSQLTGNNLFQKNCVAIIV